MHIRFAFVYNVKQKKRPCFQGLFIEQLPRLRACDAIVDSAEHVTNDRAEQHQNCNNNDGYQNKNQCIFNQALALFLRCKQHNIHLLSILWI